MKIKLKSITAKILISYLVLVICSTAITALSFRSILAADLEKRTKKSLNNQARDTAMLLMRNKENLGVLPEVRHRRPVSDLFPDHPVESQYLILDREGVIVYSSAPEQFPVGAILSDLPASQRLTYINNSDQTQLQSGYALLAAQSPIGTSEQNFGTVISYAEANALQALNREILFLLLKSLLIATAIAVPLALLLGSYLVKPINSLKEYAQAIARRRFDVRLNLKSDDELAELASTFNDMAVQLERYDNSLRRFFQSTSHELKTPLMSIQGFAEGIRDGVFSGDRAAHALETISSECQRLKNLVDEMINISKQEVPGESYSYLPCDLRSILEQSAKTLKGYAAENKIDISLNLGNDLFILGDPEKLRRLFDNLLTNALRHSRSLVSITAGHAKNGGIDIVFKDDGKGFTAQDLEHAFDYLYKGPHGGTGLGLSIAKIIVEELNGRISIGNADDGGAVVEVWFK